MINAVKKKKTQILGWLFVIIVLGYNLWIIYIECKNKNSWRQRLVNKSFVL